MVEERPKDLSYHVPLSSSVLLAWLQGYSDDLAHYEYLHQRAFFGKSIHEATEISLISIESQKTEIDNKWDALLQFISTMTDKELDIYIAEEPQLTTYRRFIKHLSKKNILNKNNQTLQLYKLLQNQSNVAKRHYEALVNQDMHFGSISIDGENIPLTRTLLSRTLVHRDRDIRRKAYHQYFRQFDAHKHALSSIYQTHLGQEILYTRILGTNSTRKRLFEKNEIDESIYDSLLTTIKTHVALFHRFFSLKKRLLHVQKLEFYDLMVPIFNDIEFHHTYEQAVSIVCESVAFLGNQFVSVLREGLLHRWVDYMERPGKSPGAFTVTSYRGGPLVLLNYKEEVPQSLFTLAHEGGHAMHSWYSISHNPFQTYEYDVLVSEIVAAVHEELLSRYLLSQEQDVRRRAFLLERQLQGMTLKLLRQTLLADFEHNAFLNEERGEPMTLQSMRDLYRSLWQQYYGPDVHLEPIGDLEWLSIDQLYTPYYAYTYPIGASIALVLADSMLAESNKTTSQYMTLLKSGGSRSPQETLALVGVDINSKALYIQAMEHYKKTLYSFNKLVESLA